MAYFGALPEENPFEKRGVIGPIRALESASKKLKLGVNTDAASAEAVAGPEPQNFKIKDAAGCFNLPLARLVYHIEDGEAFLTWALKIELSEDYVSIWVDAWEAQHIVSTQSHKIRQSKRSLGKRSSGPVDAEFLVYPWEVENPDAGSREIVSNPCEFC